MRTMIGYPLPLGTSVKDDIVNFSVAVESGKICNLCIYKCGKATPEYTIELSEENAMGEVRYVAVPKMEVEI